jgi:UDP-N-acetylglucosamine 2-epimerase (non-hydrolysing)
LRDELFALTQRFAPDLVMVQGDTLTAYTAARAAHDAGCAVAHVEAGLRTDAILEPFPEEWFRRRIARYAQIHFAPSAGATGNLLAEGIDGNSVHHVGNTGIDSLKRLLAESEFLRSPLKSNATLLATLHRRANYDGNTIIVCEALAEIAAARPGLRVLFPIHPNPRVAGMIRRKLGAHAAFDLIDPMPYKAFVKAAAHSVLIVSDSGGIQEEAPHLGTLLLVPRCNTERPESLATGFVRLVPVDRASIVRFALEALQAPRRAAVPIDNDAPYGDGDAATRIVGILEKTLIDRSAA